MPLIELQHVQKQFSGKSGHVTAVNDVSLTVEQGDIYGIVGYSGAGKSTLVRLLNGLELPTQGEVIIQGQNVAQMANRELRQFRKKIGMIFQHFNLLWSRTILENIMLPLELANVPKNVRKNRAQELLSLVGLEGRGDAYPSQLSGGQKQRVGIARALANNPEILLCDEATSALDPQTTDEVLDLLLEINKTLNLTIVLITHEMHVIRKICNKVAVMELGQIVEEGDVLEVFKHPKQAVTKRFVQQELEPKEDTEELLQELIKENPAGLVATLQFSGDNANEPVISQAIRKFAVDINVVQGQVQQAKEGAFGTLTVMVTGTASEVEKTLLFFKEKEVGLEVIHHGE
ncbi:ABC transporter ATP-binding protein [Enterococcus moraviensis ATCC BAA-383]|uniref:ABC transporter ATP-binding protein n=1 Tax=Enterococcus moraviensis ATCC BAA-383 TaxID=1158609 RepID=R2QQH9_9ENTE|nr:ATP-binding cassette domain-containing protein [Enterococcus moraviensis]EOH98797.1 ABC transporter ATP-binding protein [Enterococcus moraviensis ATCC BAA-383]EOT72028.1 ABC transporter ATP-binding protein [Enterococcus moraviensis ATCC BAA-383]OJG68148.1 ABC transporter ATP-binding protein [Enterococcus moraviensis]